MPSILDTAEDVEKKHPTATNNNASLNEGTGPAQIAPQEKPEKPHGFSKTAAEQKKGKKKLGWNAAILLRYLAFRLRKHGKNIDGKRWVRINLDQLSDQYSYLGRSTIDELITKLVEFGACEVENKNSYFTRVSYDRTNCFHIPQKWSNMAEEEIRYFLPSVAKEVDVPGAAIFYNFMHWICEWSEEGMEPCARLAPATIKTLQPFSTATIKRALGELKTKKFIAPLDNNLCWYVAASKAGSSKPDEPSSNPDMGSSDPDETGSNPDNNNNCRELKDSLEESSKVQPAAGFSNSSPCAEKQNDACNSSITTEADGQERLESSVDHSDIDAPNIPTASSLGTRGSAEGAGGIWPIMESLEQIHAINRSNADIAEHLCSRPRSGDQFLSIVSSSISSFLATLDPKWLDQLYAEADEDELFAAFLPHYLEFLSSTRLTPSSPYFELIYFGMFECIIGGFLYSRNGREAYSHPMRHFIRLCYSISIPLRQRAEAERLKAVDEEFQEFRAIHASRDAHLEDKTSLTPAEKTRVFRNALNLMNKVGWIFYDQQHHTNEIRVTTEGLRGAQRLFELNPHTSVRDLVKIMEGCMNLRASRPAPKRFSRGVQWHARMGNNLTTFVRYLPGIVRQLGMEGTCAFSVLRNIDSSMIDHEEEEEQLAA